MADKIYLKKIFLKNFFYIYLPLIIIMLSISKTNCSLILLIFIMPTFIIYTIIFNLSYIYKNCKEANLSSKISSIIFFLILTIIITGVLGLMISLFGTGCKGGF